MNVRYIDAHCHLQFESYASDREELFARMRSEGVAAIVVGDDCQTSRQAVELASAHDFLYAAVGVHPHHAPNVGHIMSDIREFAKRPRVVAIGECGLDYYDPKWADETESKRLQKEAFEKHIALAAERDLPLMIHARPTKGTQDAYHDVLAILRDVKHESTNLRGNVHFFSGGIKEANAFFELGFTISFTAVITFARNYDSVIRAVPLGMILAETDAPFVAPAGRRGERNDPLAVIDVVAKIAEIRGEPFETIREATLANAKRLFKLGTS